MYTKRATKIAELENFLDKDVYLLCHNRRKDAYIDGTMIDVLRRMMDVSKRRNGAALIIQTPGGDLNEAYYIGEFFREYYDTTESYVVSDCYSGGTLIALSTDKIFLSHSGCLGPIDIQRSMLHDEKAWYPALSGQIEALNKAEKDKKISKFLKDAFNEDMDILATYFKESYTYKELIGDNVKKHCVDEKNAEKIWEYLTALNISHGSPLTYSRLKKLGLKVELMDTHIEKLIKSVIRDVEHEFGDLKEVSLLHDFFNGATASVCKAPVDRLALDDEEIEDEYEETGRKRKMSRGVIRRQYTFGKVEEKLAVIETSVCGYVQSRKVGITFEDNVPVYLAVISSGWDEEANSSLVTDEQKEDLAKVLQCYATILNPGINASYDDDPIKYQLMLNTAYNALSEIAIETFEKRGIDTESISSAELYKMITEFIINNPDIIGFEENVEEMLKKYAHKLGFDYGSLGAVDKIDLYEDFFNTVEDQMLRETDISEDDYDKLSDDEQSKMVMEFAMENEIEVPKE